MEIPVNNQKNRGELATKVIDSWDHNDLYNYAHQQLEEAYKNEEAFKYDWLAMEED